VRDTRNQAIEGTAGYRRPVARHLLV